MVPSVGLRCLPWGRCCRCCSLTKCQRDGTWSGRHRPVSLPPIPFLQDFSALPQLSISYVPAGVKNLFLPGALAAIKKRFLRPPPIQLKFTRVACASLDQSAMQWLETTHTAPWDPPTSGNTTMSACRSPASKPHNSYSCPNLVLPYTLSKLGCLKLPRVCHPAHVMRRSLYAAAAKAYPQWTKNVSIANWPGICSDGMNSAGLAVSMQWQLSTTNVPAYGEWPDRGILGCAAVPGLHACMFGCQLGDVGACLVALRELCYFHCPLIAMPLRVPGCVPPPPAGSSPQCPVPLWTRRTPLHTSWPTSTAWLR